MKREQVKRQLIARELTFAAVMERLKLALELPTDAELAKQLGMSTSNYANRKRSDSVPFDLVLPLCIERGLSLDWLFADRGAPFADGRLSDIDAPARVDSSLLGEVFVEVAKAFSLDPFQFGRIGMIAALIYPDAVVQKTRAAKLAKARELAASYAVVDRLGHVQLPTADK